MNNSADSSLSTVGKESVRQETRKELSLQRQGKDGFKSLTALSARDSLESLQKLHRRGDSCLHSRRRLFGRGADKRARKKFRKRLDKPNVSEVNIRKVARADDEARLVSVVSPRRVSACPGKSKQSSEQLPKSSIDDVLDEYFPCVPQASNTKATVSQEVESQATNEYALSSVEISQTFEKLSLGNESLDTGLIHQSNESKNVIDYGCGDAQQDFSLDLDLGLANDEFADLACAQMFDSKKRSVQWKREVDVIYYAGDARGGKVIRRENEPLREEAEQQARRNRFIQLALTKSLLSNACQFRDPWLVMMPK